MIERAMQEEALKMERTTRLFELVLLTPSFLLKVAGIFGNGVDFDDEEQVGLIVSFY
jgi:hypothetical protein